MIAILNNLEEILEIHIPRDALSYCLDLSQKHKFNFKLYSNRKTKIGDYKYDPATKNSQISVNRSLNSYSFLITFIHEIAHLVATKTFGRKIAPHGKEWKSTFKQLMLPLIIPDIFPENLLRTLAKHLINPKASTHADPVLVRALQAYDMQRDGFKQLDRIGNGNYFSFNGKRFQYLEKRRTRIVCRQVSNDKKYLVAGTTLVAELD